MTNDLFLNNLLKYAGSILLGGLTAGLAALLVQLSGTDPIVWRPVFAAALGPVVTGLIAMRLTKAGREEIGALVSELGSGQARDALEVEAIRQQTGIGGQSALSDEDIGRLADRVLAENEARQMAAKEGGRG